MERVEEPAAFDPKRPKISLRRFTNPIERLAIKQYIINKKRHSAQAALENIYKILRRSK